MFNFEFANRMVEAVFKGLEMSLMDFFLALSNTAASVRPQNKIWAFFGQCPIYPKIDPYFKFFYFAFKKALNVRLDFKFSTAKLGSNRAFKRSLFDLF